ncbi:hypothetical protein T4D_2336 [Trichinella pseudospiralis]|uniref:Uncharacterized protein n=1 Tax=Trichinella pseudospiralis TaxID=6337 RepID=A0A0V1FF81_TRIPS|nr:hypothetical protein T4D_2336 [Trichinella pseudospiralis]
MEFNPLYPIYRIGDPRCGNFYFGQHLKLFHPAPPTLFHPWWSWYVPVNPCCPQRLHQHLHLPGKLRYVTKRYIHWTVSNVLPDSMLLLPLL